MTSQPDSVASQWPRKMRRSPAEATSRGHGAAHLGWNQSWPTDRGQHQWHSCSAKGLKKTAKSLCQEYFSLLMMNFGSLSSLISISCLAAKLRKKTFELRQTAVVKIRNPFDPPRQMRAHLVKAGPFSRAWSIPTSTLLHRTQSNIALQSCRKHRIFYLSLKPAQLIDMINLLHWFMENGW